MKHDSNNDETLDMRIEELDGLDDFAGEMTQLLSKEAPRPDETLTGRVMDQLPCARSCASGRMLGSVYAFFDSDRVLSHLVRGITRSSSCSSIFLVAGLFHLVYGLIIRTGLTHVPFRPSLLPEWVMLQPVLAYIAGVGFLAAGVLLRKLGPRAYRAAQVVTLAYLLLVVVNGTAILGTMRISAMLLATISLVGSGLIIGLFLGAVLLKCTEGGRQA
ncbi:hypothetical protein [Oceanidesulfovibrio marinus]|uniref:Uncharacterized protein n=1 Tax=Oceanidesulfovibrio marinus TaxID=370038 RepID=A0A6P1ZKJ1_9BACT|nr:hypothetical protein [Oceanidesulfovibrio marinus]QJT09110.1 hypothetical protein E8L03_09260 [Oceanidesulfovibrio marinus]TVM36461.1 hypothetical protein DQK91_00615 [Oceanidesulfovibrio marinus]